MGINQCSKGRVLWKATGFNPQALKSLGLGNRIDVDGNFLFHQLQGSGGKTAETIVKIFSIPVVTKRNWFEKLPLHWCLLYYFIGGIIIGLLLPYVW